MRKMATLIAALTLATTLTTTVTSVTPAHASETPGTQTSIYVADISAVAAATDIQPQRWVAQWQMWDWTQYRSHVTCMSRGRQIMRAFPDVQQITCRKPPRCAYWNLFTFRKQWV